LSSRSSLLYALGPSARRAGLGSEEEKTVNKVIRGLSAIVAFCVVAAGSAVAQPWHGEVDEGDSAMALFQALRNALQEGGVASGPFAEVRVVAHLGATVLSGNAPYEGEPSAICAFLVGGGGNPRLDGGGGLLGFRPPAAAAQPWVVQLGKHVGLGPSADLWPEVPSDRLVIIDQFELDDLVSSINDILEVSNAVTIAPGDPGPSALWHAMYGYRLVRESSTPVDEVEVPHGHLVAFHALAHLGPDANVVGVAHSDHGLHEVAILSVERDGDTASAFEVHLVHVDFEEFESIESAINAYRGASANVVVTSWGFVDCAIESHYRASDPASHDTITMFFQDALAASGQATGVLEGLCAALEEIITGILGSPPDCRDIDSLAELATIVWIADVSMRSERLLRWEPGGARFFASAGNQGLSIPMPPAAWPALIGVEACSGSSKLATRASPTGARRLASVARAGAR
jgi:hypothetical protein